MTSLGRLPTPPAGEPKNAPGSLLAPVVTSLREKPVLHHSSGQTCAHQQCCIVTLSLLPLWVRWSLLPVHEGEVTSQNGPARGVATPGQTTGLTLLLYMRQPQACPSSAIAANDAAQRPALSQCPRSAGQL